MHLRACSLIELTWLAAAVGVPLVVFPWGGSMVELPKVVLLRVIVAVSMPAAILAVARIPRHWQWGGAVVALGAAASFGLLLTLATLVSEDERLSLWGSYARQYGLAAILPMLLLFGAVATLLRSSNQRARLHRALVWTSAPIVAYGLAQAAGLDPLRWQAAAASVVMGTIGRSNHLGTYLVLIAPLTLALALEKPRRWAYWGLLLAQASCLLLTLSRAATIGLGTALLVFGLGWAIAKRRVLAAVLGSLAVTSLAGLVLLSSVPDAPLASLATLPGLDRFGALSHPDEGSAGARLIIWRTTESLVAARPWLGYGPDGMIWPFTTLFPPDLAYYLGRDVLVDRAHNLELDLAASAGIPATLAFFALVGAALWRLARKVAGTGGQATWAERILSLGILSAVIGHLLDLQFSFESIATGTTFWLLLGLALATVDQEAVVPNGAVVRAPARSWLVGVSALLAALLFVEAGLRPQAADFLYFRSTQLDLPLTARISDATRAAELWPYEPTYRAGLAALYGQLGDLPAAQAQARLAVALEPANPDHWRSLGRLDAVCARQNGECLKEAEDAYRTAIALAPNLAAYHLALGSLLVYVGRVREAVPILQRALSLDSTADGARQLLALATESLAVPAVPKDEKEQELAPGR